MHGDLFHAEVNVFDPEADRFRFVDGDDYDLEICNYY
jgi:hypothetical protein